MLPALLVNQRWAAADGEGDGGSLEFEIFSGHRGEASLRMWLLNKC